MPRILRCAATGLALVGLAGAGSGGLAAQLVKPPLVTPTVMVAGPSWLSAGSDYPTHFVVKWTAVSGAGAYRISRWTGTDPKLVRTVSASGLTPPAEPGYAVFIDMYRTLVTPVYSYQVDAVFYSATGATTFSTLSPVGSAQSVPFLAPANLQVTMLPQVSKFEVQLLLTHDQVPKGRHYYFTGTVRGQGQGSTATLPSSSVGTGPILFDARPTASAPPNDGTLLRIPLLVNKTYTFCLSTVYYDGIRDDTVKNCLTVPL